MKAIIMMGGHETKLRPLTLTQPKPLIEFANKPMLFHQIENLVKNGVKTIILSISFNIDLLQEELSKYAKKIGIEIICSEECKLSKTGGCLLQLSKYFTNNEIFYLLNSDIICDFPLNDMLAFHISHNKEGTIGVTRIIEENEYQIINYNKFSGKVISFGFMNKDCCMINSGIYIFNSSIFGRIKSQRDCIEKDIFKEMIKVDNLYAFKISGFWMKVVNPKDYIKGVNKYLEFLEKNNSSLLYGGSNVIGNVLVDSSATVENNCSIGPNVVIGAGVTIQYGSRLKNCTILKNTIIKKNSLVNDCIIGRNCTVGCWSRIDKNCVIGDNVNIKDELYLNGACIFPHKSISTDIPEPNIIM
uniref:mannose-1-phosphate guanylyltransferase n=1 Tax=Parastrongyloides trichosuri TaxID=131310 RepID=A0A0N4ZHW5_PARTI